MDTADRFFVAMQSAFDSLTQDKTARAIRERPSYSERHRLQKQRNSQLNVDKTNKTP